MSSAPTPADPAVVPELFSRAPDVVLRNIVGEHFLIVLHAGESKMFSLNRMGLWFWNQVERPVGKKDLLAAMQRDYDVSEPVAAQEIDRFVHYLLERHLVVRCASSE